MIDKRTPGVFALAGYLALAPALAQSSLEGAPARLVLQVPNDAAVEQCRRLDTANAVSVSPASLHRTFHDDFDEHPLSKGTWASHYAGGAAWPAARYWGGDGSDFKRKTAWNGEQQIYVDPRYGGRNTPPRAVHP